MAGELPGCCDILTTLPVAETVVQGSEGYGRYRQAHRLTTGQAPAEILAEIAAYRLRAKEIGEP